MSVFMSVEGTVTEIKPISIGRERRNECCTLMMSIRGERQEITNFIVDNDTYFINNAGIQPGDRVTAFYDSSLATPAIYPPQYRAVVIAKKMRGREVVVDTFDRFRINSDGSLRLNITDRTDIIMRNGQKFLCDIANRYVAVVYNGDARGYPAEVIPYEIIVLCR